METNVCPERTDTASPELERLVALRTQELKCALERAQSLYDQAPCGYLSLDAELRFANINRTLLDWLGYPARGGGGRHGRVRTDRAGVDRAVADPGSDAGPDRADRADGNRSPPQGWLPLSRAVVLDRGGRRPGPLPAQQHHGGGHQRAQVCRAARGQPRRLPAEHHRPDSFAPGLLRQRPDLPLRQHRPRDALRQSWPARWWAPT